jgi:urease accessory protein
MLVADRYLGHRSDENLAARLAETDPHRAALSDTDRRRSRARTETIDGRDLGIVVARELGEGDVLATEDGELVVVELEAVDALVVDLADATLSPTDALAFGHAAGNRHWNLAVRDGEALFPVPDTRERMLDAVADDLPDGVAARFERVPPTTFDDGGGPGAHADHGHGHGDGTHAHTHHEDGHVDENHSHDHGVRSIDDPRE